MSRITADLPTNDEVLYCVVDHLKEQIHHLQNNTIPGDCFWLDRNGLINDIKNNCKVIMELVTEMA